MQFVTFANLQHVLSVLFLEIVSDYGGALALQSHVVRTAGYFQSDFSPEEP